MQDFPALVERYGLELNGYFDSGRPAVLDGTHLVRLNYEAFFFADTAGRDRFLTSPITYCGLLTDPVSKRRFRPGTGSPRVLHDGVTFYFESTKNERLFRGMPDRYRLPGYRMEPDLAKPAMGNGPAATSESSS